MSGEETLKKSTVNMSGLSVRSHLMFHEKSRDFFSFPGTTRRQLWPCCDQQEKSELVRSTVAITSTIIHLCASDTSLCFVIGSPVLLYGTVFLSLLLEEICHAVCLRKHIKISIVLFCLAYTWILKNIMSDQILTEKKIILVFKRNIIDQMFILMFITKYLNILKFK